MKWPRYAYSAAAVWCFLILMFAVTEAAEAQRQKDLRLGAQLGLGTAHSESGGNGFAGFGATVALVLSPLSPNVTYFNAHILRNCKTTCPAGVSEGHLVAAGASLALANTRMFGVHARPEAGVALWRDEVLELSGTELLLGAAGTIRLEVARVGIEVEPAVRYSHSATLLGAWAGLSFRF